MNESTFHFINYRIGKIDSVIAENFGKEPEKLNQTINVTNELSAEEPRNVTVYLHININAETGNFKFNTVVAGYFEAHDDMPEELFNKLCEVNAPAILLPYARSIITNFTALCNIKPIILPLFNLTKNKEEDKESKE